VVRADQTEVAWVGPAEQARLFVLGYYEAGVSEVDGSEEARDCLRLLSSSFFVAPLGMLPPPRLDIVAVTCQWQDRGLSSARFDGTMAKQKFCADSNANAEAEVRLKRSVEKVDISATRCAEIKFAQVQACERTSSAVDPAEWRG
jgi:hypothetical protein